MWVCPSCSYKSQAGGAVGGSCPACGFVDGNAAVPKFNFQLPAFAMSNNNSNNATMASSNSSTAKDKPSSKPQRDEISSSSSTVGDKMKQGMPSRNSSGSGSGGQRVSPMFTFSKAPNSTQFESLQLGGAPENDLGANGGNSQGGKGANSGNTAAEVVPKKGNDTAARVVVIADGGTNANSQQQQQQPVAGTSTSLVVWKCTKCGKAKPLRGEHLSNKTTVRSDCWPCGVKRVFHRFEEGAQGATMGSTGQLDAESASCGGSIALGSMTAFSARADPNASIAASVASLFPRTSSQLSGSDSWRIESTLSYNDGSGGSTAATGAMPKGAPEDGGTAPATSQRGYNFPAMSVSSSSPPVTPNVQSLSNTGSFMWRPGVNNSLAAQQQHESQQRGANNAAIASLNELSHGTITAGMYLAKAVVASHGSETCIRIQPTAGCCLVFSEGVVEGVMNVFRQNEGTHVVFPSLNAAISYAVADAAAKLGRNDETTLVVSDTTPPQKVVRMSKVHSVLQVKMNELMKAAVGYEPKSASSPAPRKQIVPDDHGDLITGLITLGMQLSNRIHNIRTVCCPDPYTFAALSLYFSQIDPGINVHGPAADPTRPRTEIHRLIEHHGGISHTVTQDESVVAVREIYAHSRQFVSIYGAASWVIAKKIVAGGATQMLSGHRITSKASTSPPQSNARGHPSPTPAPEAGNRRTQCCDTGLPTGSFTSSSCIAAAGVVVLLGPLAHWEDIEALIMRLQTPASVVGGRGRQGFT